jgi:hypothetical protein
MSPTTRSHYTRALIPLYNQGHPTHDPYAIKNYVQSTLENADKIQAWTKNTL